MRMDLEFIGMTDKAASELARKRWDNATEEEKKEAGRKMNEGRWPPGYVAKRPASSRNTGRPVGRPPGAKKKPAKVAAKKKAKRVG